MLNWRQNTKKYKCRVVLRGDIVKDDSGSYAVLTEHGSSASQMTAATISWISSPDCQVAMDRQQTQYLLIPKKNERCSQIIKKKKKTKTKSECPDIWIRLPRHKWLNSTVRTSQHVKCAADKYGKPVTPASSSNLSEWNNDDKWSSQVLKSCEMSKTSTKKPVSNNLVIDIDMDSATAAEP